MIRTMFLGATVVFALAALAGQSAPTINRRRRPLRHRTGARLYGAQCSVCHGANGDLINGVDSARGKF
jgi:cytochrome c